jgi:hypothetical protein
MSASEAAPPEAVERLYQDLVAEYRTRQKQPELRAAKDLLLVALVRIPTHGGQHWQTLLDEYRDAAVQDPDRFGPPPPLLWGNRDAASIDASATSSSSVISPIDPPAG